MLLRGRRRRSLVHDDNTGTTRRSVVRAPVRERAHVAKRTRGERSIRVSLSEWRAFLSCSRSVHLNHHHCERAWRSNGRTAQYRSKRAVGAARWKLPRARCRAHGRSHGLHRATASCRFCSVTWVGTNVHGRARARRSIRITNTTCRWLLLRDVTAADTVSRSCSVQSSPRTTPP